VLVVTGGSKNLLGCICNLRCSAKGFGYKFLVYDYSGRDNGVPFLIDFDSYKERGRRDYNPKLSHKPLILLDAFDRIRDEFFVYMDCDTEFVDPIPEVATHDYDIGITAHPAAMVGCWRTWHCYPEMSAYLNAGVMFFNRTENTKRFLRIWNREVKKTDTGSDQHALQNIVSRVWDPFKWYMNDIREYKGIRIKLFDSTIYNYNGRAALVWNDPKIVHHVVTTQGDKKICEDW